MKKMILTLWKLIDPIYDRYSRLHRLDNSVLRVRLTRYRGRTVKLSNGFLIQKNDLLLKIHLHNIRIFKDFNNINNIKKARRLYRHVEQSLSAVASYIKHHQKEPEIKGVIGITLIKGIDHLGLEPAKITHPIYKRWKKIIQIPIYFLIAPHPSWTHFKKQDPKYLLISKKRLTEKYGGNPAHQPISS